MTRNATCINCGTRIDMDVIKFCPYCESERERVRGYRPQVKEPGSGYFGFSGAALGRTVAWLVGTIVVVVGVVLVIGLINS